MHYTKKDIEELERVKRLNIINSISGIKPANLIGSVDNKGNANVAIFSSVVHLGSSPALLGFVIRPTGEVPRNTYDNIMATDKYTINHVTDGFTKKAHYTSAKFDKDVSEFEKCGLTPEYLEGFKAPFVKESKIKIGLTFKEGIPIKLNGTMLMIGEIEHLIVPDEALAKNGYINLSTASTAGISGLNSYYQLNKIDDYPYARPHELPEFN
ncbi:flavin oxidoreductase [Fulvivirga sp. RKSG066]|uniref:flavin reductase family protein n=1 Tax=Fulvivirga aurantia TaxID=2529383 RepID=UPI0012BB81C7|nr:flavin reductase [Fulvivirga aurantia]MTI20515.1 flavin oxidoreductase [Fulvivirga aurantia]